tara:strand:- start:255 stop:524 length:270 start_codon:yes stop_codon:yes gene_type:complete
MKFKNKGDKEKYFRSVMDKLIDDGPDSATPELVSFMIFSLIEGYQHKDEWPIIRKVVTDMLMHHEDIEGAIDDAVEFMGGIVQSRRLGE